MTDLTEASANEPIEKIPAFGSVLRYLRDPAMTDTLTDLVHSRPCR